MLFFFNPYISPLNALTQRAEKHIPLSRKVYKIYFLKLKITTRKNDVFLVSQFNKFNFPLQAPNGTFHHFAKLVEKSDFLFRFHLGVDQIRADFQQHPH